MPRRYQEPGETYFLEGERGDRRDALTLARALRRDFKSGNSSLYYVLDRIVELLERMVPLVIEEER